jgi:hypothetical protein
MWVSPVYALGLTERAKVLAPGLAQVSGGSLTLLRFQMALRVMAMESIIPTANRDAVQLFNEHLRRVNLHELLPFIIDHAQRLYESMRPFLETNSASAPAVPAPATAVAAAAAAAARSASTSRHDVARGTPATAASSSTAAQSAPADVVLVADDDDEDDDDRRRRHRQAHGGDGGVKGRGSAGSKRGREDQAAAASSPSSSALPEQEAKRAREEGRAHEQAVAQLPSPPKFSKRAGADAGSKRA